MENETIELVKKMMMELMKKIGINASVEISQKENDFYIAITGDKKGILIGKHGKTLDSLQFLFNRMVNKTIKEVIRINIDVNGYKAKRADSLKQMALRIGDRVKREGKQLTIGPFNPHDRRIIHLALKEDPELEAESLGEGEMKRIRITSKSKTH